MEEVLLREELARVQRDLEGERERSVPCQCGIECRNNVLQEPSNNA